MGEHDLLAQAQADAGPVVLVATVQALEHLEDALVLCRIDADAVVGHRQPPPVTVMRGPEGHHWRSVAMEFQRVADQVLEELHTLQAVGPYRRQGTAFDACTGLVDGGLQIGKRFVDHLVEGNELFRTFAAADARERQDVAHQFVHARRPFDRTTDEVATTVIEFGAIAFIQQTEERADHAQRFLQIVRADVGELLQLGV